MEIKNRMYDVIKLRCNVCQDFLKMKIQPNHRGQKCTKSGEIYRWI